MKYILLAVTWTIYLKTMVMNGSTLLKNKSNTDFTEAIHRTETYDSVIPSFPKPLILIPVNKSENPEDPSRRSNLNNQSNLSPASNSLNSDLSAEYNFKSFSRDRFKKLQEQEVEREKKLRAIIDCAFEWLSPTSAQNTLAPCKKLDNDPIELLQESGGRKDVIDSNETKKIDYGKSKKNDRVTSFFVKRAISKSMLGNRHRGRPKGRKTLLKLSMLDSEKDLVNLHVESKKPSANDELNDRVNSVKKRAGRPSRAIKISKHSKNKENDTELTISQSKQDHLDPSLAILPGNESADISEFCGCNELAEDVKNDESHLNHVSYSGKSQKNLVEIDYELRNLNKNVLTQVNDGETNGVTGEDKVKNEPQVQVYSEPKVEAIFEVPFWPKRKRIMHSADKTRKNFNIIK